MALIKCPECGKEISDKASSCPNCGNRVKNNKVVNKKILVIFAVVMICLIILYLMKFMSKISTDNYLYEKILGKEKSYVYNLLYKEREFLNEKDDYDVYSKQSFFGMKCDLYFYYDKNGKVKQITYYKNLNDEEEIDDFQKNIDTIIDYYSHENNNTKGREPDFVEFSEDFYKYSWWTISGEKYYDLEVSDNQISMTVM